MFVIAEYDKKKIGEMKLNKKEIKFNFVDQCQQLR